MSCCLAILSSRAWIASLESLFQMRPQSHVLVPWPMKFNARFLQHLFQIKFAPFLAPSSPGLGRQGLPSGLVLFLTALRSHAHRDTVGGSCQNPASWVSVVIYLYVFADQAVPSIISATLSPIMGSPPKESSPESTNGVLVVLGGGFLLLCFVFGHRRHLFRGYKTKTLLLNK